MMIDCALSPVQQRNLEKALGRQGHRPHRAILEIFGARARTKEGALQVELAHLNYQKSRLVRSWTHLERQRGGFGFLGGPGETQIEADRRMIQERIVRIERELETVKRTRALHRESRRKVPYPIVALVGYTNAGKSTLFNRLTRRDVFAEDLLFATLDPTARVVKLPHGAPIILSDTVGFISDLPTMLVAAFRATLEDVISADVILHVRDVAPWRHRGAVGRRDGDPARPRHRIQTITAGSSRSGTRRTSSAQAERERLLAIAEHRPDEGRPVVVSALTGEGIDGLKAAIEQRLSGERPVFVVELDPADGRRSALALQGSGNSRPAAGERQPHHGRRAPCARKGAQAAQAFPRRATNTLTGGDQLFSVCFAATQSSSISSRLASFTERPIAPRADSTMQSGARTWRSCRVTPPRGPR